MLFVIFKDECHIGVKLSPCFVYLEGDPIIIVSGGDQALLNMRNIQEFLDKGQYVSLSSKVS